MFNKLRKEINYKLINWQMKKGHSVLLGKPFSLVLDTCSFCNLECVWCPTGQKRNTRTKCIMSYEKVIKIFKKLGPYLKKVMLCNWGEPFLNKDLIREIMFIQKHYDLQLILSTNLNTTFSEEQASSLVNSDLDVLICSIDGIRQDTYETYRRKGNLSIALENLKLITKAKKENNTKKPLVIWQYLVFKHNEHELREAEKLAKEIGVDKIKFTKPWCPQDWTSTLPQYTNYQINGDSCKKEYKQLMCCKNLKRFQYWKNNLNSFQIIYIYIQGLPR